MHKIVSYSVGSAITVLNAIKSSRGSAIGTKIYTTAEVTAGNKIETYGVDTSLVEGCMKLLGVDNLSITVSSPLPPARGLKTSSSVSLAVLGALGLYLDLDFTDEQLVSMSARVSIEAGVSVTGAFDDAYACLKGGWVVTDTKSGKLLERREVISSPVILLVPESRNEKFRVDNMLENIEHSHIKDALDHLEAGDLFGCIQSNTRAYSPILGDYELIQRLIPLADVVGLNGAGPSIFLLNPTVNLDIIRNQAPKYNVFLTSTR